MKSTPTRKPASKTAQLWARSRSNRRQTTLWTLIAYAASVPGFCGQSATAAELPVASSPKPAFDKPDWVTDLAVGVKESYDNNVFLN